MRIVRPYPLALAGATLAVALSVSSMTANAASTFLMQFGQHDTEAAAREQWDSLQAEHPELLGDKVLRVAPVTTPSGSETYRTQASGVDSREDAQNTCNTLNAQNVTCLVVETSMYMPAEQVATTEADVEVEMTSEEMDGVTMEMEGDVMPQTTAASGGVLPWLDEPAAETDAAAEFESQIAAAAPTEQVQTNQPLRPERVDGETLTPQTAPVEQATETQAPAPIEQAAPTRVEPQAWPEQVDRTVAADMSDDLAANETRVVESRAPRSLNAQVAAQNPQVVAPNTSVEPVAPQVAPQAASSNTEVEVAEAIQVPLSFDDSFDKMVAAPPAPVNKPVGYAGYPSQPMQKRTLWVQVSQFASKQAAMNYWRELTATRPELMRLLRVRIVTPWNNTYGRRHASLRMGPFTDQASIDALCSSAAERDLRCTMVRQLGGSTAASSGRSMHSPMQRYQRRQAVNRGYSSNGGQPSGMFWVQLGAFDTVDAAQQRWGQLKTVHTDVLGRMHPQISYPAFSSSPSPVYHLRTGPFVNQGSAVNICNRLQNRHLGCIVVQTR